MYTDDRNSVPDRLLAGALRCLREKGYAQTTARDVAAASQCNLRSIGYHFGSTKGLLLAAISLNFRDWLAPLIEPLSDSGLSPDRQLRLGLRQFTRSLPEEEPILRVWLEAVVLSGFDPALRWTLAENQAAFAEALAETMSAAGLSNPKPRAQALISVCDGLIVRYLIHGEVGDPLEAASLLSGELAAVVSNPQPEA
jgi:AcrR family transcriptional regulator